MITVVTDSAYVMNCFIERWWHTWVDKDWRKKQGEVKNRDLWEELIELVVENDVQFRKVKGHSGDRMNDLVDKLAVKAKKAQLTRD